MQRKRIKSRRRSQTTFHLYLKYQNKCNMCQLYLKYQNKSTGVSDSTSLAAPVEEQVRQEFLDSTIRASQPTVERVQQDQSQIPNLQANEQSRAGPSTNKRKRGATQMQAVDGRTEHQLIVLNKLNHPIGPTKAVVTEFFSFLGTLARNWTFCPLNLTWTKLKTHDKMWSYIQEKYDIPNNGKDWAIRSDVVFRGCKSRLKKDHLYAYPNDEIRRAKRPTFVPEPIFEDLLVYWNSEEAENTSKTNKENRKKFKYPHTMGKTSFALIREEKKMENSGALSNKEFFMATRTRKPDRIYKDTSEEITNKIVEMERVETQESEDGTQSTDAFTKAMGPNHHGRVRLLGRGVTKTLLKQKASDSRSSSKSDELVEKRLDDLEERMQQRMNSQRDVIE
ncbi:hypothetical protein P3S67_028430 [Capsicum chacoense]